MGSKRTHSKAQVNEWTHANSGRRLQPEFGWIQWECNGAHYQLPAVLTASAGRKPRAG